MTKKNARKVAARRLQTQFGGKYCSHYQRAGAITEKTVTDSPSETSDVEEVEDFEDDYELEPVALEVPQYPCIGFSLDFGEELKREHPEVQEMCNWFFCRFEDPVENTPYETAEGGYQYIWGGPFCAREEISNAFPNAFPDHLERAIDVVEEHGIEWVKIRG